MYTLNTPIHISLWNFYKKVRRGGDQNVTRMEAVHNRINGRVPFIGVGDLFAEENGVIIDVSKGKYGNS